MICKLIDAYKTHGRDHGPGFHQELVAESVAAKKLPARRPRFSIRRAAEHAMGPGWHASLSEYAGRRRFLDPLTAESTDPSVGATAFAAVTGAVMIEAIDAGYAMAMSDADNLVSNMDTPDDLDTATIAYRGKATDKALTVGEAQEYPKTGLSGWTVAVPRPEKIGLRCDVTLEAIVADRTSELIDAAGEVGEQVGIEVKERILRVILGITATYVLNGSSYNTYLTTGAWVNSLDDFNQANGVAEFDRAMQLMANMVDPVTGKNIEIRLNALQILVPPGNLFVTRRNFSTQEIRTTSGATEVVQGNPLANLPAPISDPQMRRLLVEAGLTTTQADTYVIIADFKRAFGWRQVRPFQVLERDGELASEIGFNQDIVYSAKARAWGAAFVREPRYAYRMRKMA